MSRVNAFNGGFGGFSALVSGDNPNEYKGAVMLFAQTAAPTGWTKDTTYDDYALRITSGTVSTGGSVNFSTAFASRSVAGSFPGGSLLQATTGTTALTAAELPSHSHTYTNPAIYSGPSVPVSSPTYVAAVIGQGQTGGPGGQTGFMAQPGNPASGVSTNPAFSPSSFSTLGPTAASGAGHSHTVSNSPGGTFTGINLNMAVKYLDMIIASYPV